MNEKFEEILDKCIDGINSGQSIEECLAQYPEHAAELMPLLKTVAGARKAIPFTPMATKKQEAREQLLAAIGTHDVKGRRPFLAGLFRKTKVWASAAAAAAVALIAVFAVGPLLANNPAPALVQGDLALMVSDDAELVDLFDSVDITINEIGLYHETEGWQSIIPNVTTLDLTDIKGILAIKVWEGELPVGHYTTVKVDIASVDAVFNGLDVHFGEISLELEIPCDVTEEDITNYVYDITLLNIDGQPRSVEDESGPDQEFQLIPISAP